MKQFYWLLLMLSATSYALPFIFSEYLWWLVFLFPVPLFYAVLHEKLTFKHGFAWGIVSFSLHLSGVGLAIIGMLQGPLWLKIMPTLFLVFYFALCSGIWFWLTNSLRSLIKNASSTVILVLWSFSLWFFTMWIDQYSLWILGRCEGNFFIHPLLPLATHPQLLRLVPILGKHLLTLLFLMVPACITFFLHKKNKTALLTTGIALIPWIFYWLAPQTIKKPPDWINKITSLPMMFTQTQDLESTIYVLQQQFKTIVEQKPHTEIIIMPESSLYCDICAAKPELLKYWDKVHLGKPLHVIIGAFRQENEKYHNCLYWIYDGKIQQHFDKKHAMPLIERKLPWLNVNYQNHFFSSFWWPITPSRQNRPLLNLCQNSAFVPYICSELFFNEKLDDAWPEKPILVICNDYWFGTSAYPAYMQKLMYLTTRFKALQWQRGILYTAFSQSVYFDQAGNHKKIQ